MDEAVEMVVTGTKYQNYQTIISIFFSGLNGLYFYLIPFLFKKPILSKNPQNINNKMNYTLNNYTLSDICTLDEINSLIDYKNSINNYSLLYRFFCKDNILLFQIIIIVYYVGKVASSILLGYYTDKYGRLLILSYGPILANTSYNFFYFFIGRTL